MSSIENERNIKCGACKCWRTENDFISKNRKLKSCIVCRERGKKNYQEHKEELIEKQKKYNEEHKQELTEYKKKHYQENKEELLEKQKKYNEEHKQEIKQYHKQYQKQYIEEHRQENPLHIKFKFMIQGSKQSDKKYNRTYNEEDFITEDFLNELWVKQNEKCFYENCECKLTLDFNKDFRNPTQISIQRLNNDIAHIKDNCVLSCLKCNHTHKEDADFYKKMVERAKQYQ